MWHTYVKNMKTMFKEFSFYLLTEHTPPSQVGVSEAHGLVPSTSNGASIMSQR